MAEEESIGLETLNCILSLYSEDLLKDCPKLIEKLLKSAAVSASKESSHFLHKNAFSGVKALLNLYENLQRNQNKSKSELPVNIIIQAVEHIIHCSSEECNLPDQNVQCDTVSVVFLFYKNIVLQNSQELLDQLTEFYNFLLTGIENSQKKCTRDCIIFKLRILGAVYQAFVQIKNNEFLEKFKSSIKLDECELFANLVLHFDDNVAIHTLMHLIPVYISCFKDCNIVEVTWKQISDLKADFCDNTRLLTVLCNFFGIFGDKFHVKNYVEFLVKIMEDAKFWELVQCALVGKDLVKRKQAMYLLKKSLDLLNNTNKNIMCSSKEEIIFSWNLNNKDELYKVYSEIITALEFLEEQQVHIIEPFFSVIKTLVKCIIENNVANFSWIIVIFKKALMHDSTQIVKLGLNEFLNLPLELFSNEFIIKESVELLVTTLNNTSLYYNNGFAISELLRKFIMKLEADPFKIFLNLFIKKICSEVWSAETLFFVTNSLVWFKYDYQKAILGVEEVSAIRTFASTVFKTHNKMIRTVVQCQLLAVVSCLTDTKKVPLENIILLLSKLTLKEILNAEGEIGYDFVFWLYNAYTKQEAEGVLQRYKRGELGEEFNEKFISLLMILFNFVELENIMETNNFIYNYLNEILSSFKEMDKRLYCNKLLYDQYLAIVCNIFEGSTIRGCMALIRDTLPFVNDILMYIQMQLQQMSTVQDFNNCISYLNAFRIIPKTCISQKLFTEYKFEKIIAGVMRFLKESETDLLNSSFPSIGIYWRIKVLEIAVESYSFRPEPRFLNSYLLKRLNAPLEKDHNHSENSRDLQTLWGRINAEFLEGKWKILENSVQKKLIVHKPFNSDITEFPLIKEDELARLCAEILHTGGYGVLCPVMSTLTNLLPVLENFVEVRSLVDSIWKLIMERRKTEEFKLLVKHFVEMLYQEDFILKGDFAIEILFRYSDIIFCDTSLAVINTFMKQIQQIDLLNCSMSLFCHIAAKGLIFGPFQKKDERLTSKICHYIMKNNGDFDTHSEIRARAVRMILVLNTNSPTDKVVTRNLIETLFKMESEISKNRSRYFGNSHVHRVKHRLMQALLILEPMLNENEEKAKEIGDWLLDCLLKQNSQPSVRYMQEWLFIRMMVRHSCLESSFFKFYYCTNFNFTEITKKGLCSLIGIIYHECRQKPEKIHSGLSRILFFCFHQHIEVRLYALVAFWYLLKVAYSVNSGVEINNYDEVYNSLSNWIDQTKYCNEKNFMKLLNNFYFVNFDPSKSYSLGTIYKILPKITNVDEDEWISLKMFKRCGDGFKDINIPIQISDTSIPHHHNIHNQWSLEEKDYIEFTACDEEKSDNYQKKIIPKKLWIPDYDKNNTSHTAREDGLVVVASLIDRKPNLGGLARTCEIFGASEFVVNSLKCTEDKQFISLSVTAEKWITMKEVKIQNLVDYILKMKQDGYTVVGAEQALNSIPLNSVNFPKKSLLLLGNEKEGIPPNFLPLLDICVEIPQLGIIRSLNVHVTGALFIWEYAKQNNYNNVTDFKQN